MKDNYLVSLSNSRIAKRLSIIGLIISIISLVNALAATFITKNANRPFIQMVNASTIVDSAKDQVEITITVMNKGKNPAKMNRIRVELAKENGKSIEQEIYTGDWMLLPDETHEFTLKIPRQLYIDELEMNVDLLDLDPGTFTYIFNYSDLVNSIFYYKQEIVFASSVWVEK